MGQAKKNRRDCPALGRLITPLECGEGRGTRIACPADCPHFPFAAQRYDDAREIVARASEVQAERFRRDPARREIVEPMFERDPGLKASHRYYLAMARERDPQTGRTFLEAWRDDRFDGLKNDERVVIASLLGLKFALLQIERIVDEETFLGRDLLDGEDSAVREFRDRGVCASSGQFMVFLTAIHAFPHYGRVWSMNLPLPTVPGVAPLDLLLRVATHLGCAGRDREAVRGWAEAHLPRLEEAFDAIATAVRKRFIDALSGQAAQRWYQLLASPEELKARLAQEEVFEPIPLQPGDAGAGLTQRFLWAAESGPDLPEIGAEVRGTVAFGPSRVVLESTASAKAEALRLRFEACAGEQVRFEREEHKDHAPALRGVEIYDESLVPPDLLEQQGAATVGQFTVSASELGDEGTLPQRLALAWLDERIPMFQGRTPREAVQDPALLPLVRQQLRAMIAAEDLSRVRGRPFLDYNPVLEALGQDDLRHHLPAGWEPPRHASDEEDDLGILHWPERLQNISDLEIPATPLTHELLDERAVALVKRVHLEGEIQTGYADAIDLLIRNADQVLSEDETTHLLQAFLSLAGLICAPAEPRFGFNAARLEDRADQIFEALELGMTASRGARDFDLAGIIQQYARQPLLAERAAALILESHFEGPKSLRTRAEMVAEMISLAVAALDELDACVSAWQHQHGGNG